MRYLTCHRLSYGPETPNTKCMNFIDIHRVGHFDVPNSCELRELMYTYDTLKTTYWIIEVGNTQ